LAASRRAITSPMPPLERLTANLRALSGVKTDMARPSHMALAICSLLGSSLALAACGASNATAAPSSVTTPPPPATSQASPAHSTSRPVPGVVADCLRTPHQLSIQPAGITLACADNGLGVENMTWTSWTTSAATGMGTLWEKLCKPNCAVGQIGTYPVAVTLSAVKASSQGPWFSRLTVTWEANRPPSETPYSFLTPPEQLTD
jgi:hypothetical protein